MFVRRIAALGVIVAAAAIFAGSASASGYTWPANAWGECNTSRPYSAEAEYIWFVGLNTAGHPSNWAGTQCKYIELVGSEWTGFFYLPVWTGVNWNRACWLDAAGLRYHVVYRSSDQTYWCALG